MPARTIGCDERQRSAGLEDLGAGQDVGRGRCLVLVELGQLARPAAGRRTRGSQPPGPAGPRAPEAGRAAAGSTGPRSARRSARRARHTLPSGRPPSRPKRADQLAHQERRPPGGLQAGIDEPGIGRLAQTRPATNCATARPRQWRQMEHLGGRIGCQRRQQPGVGACLARPRGHDQRPSTVPPAAEQEREEPQRGRIRPVRVVDGKAHRLRRG